MSSIAASQRSEAKSRLLRIEGAPGAVNPAVQEIESASSQVGTSENAPAATLHQWMEANQFCPCGPRQCAEADLALKIEELARSNHDLEQFAYVASHDLQEPLRMVAAYTQLLSERYHGQLDETADRYLGYAAEGALRMQTLIQDLLDFSRVGRSDREPEAVDCNQAAQRAQENLRKAITESGAVIRCGTLPEIWADGSQVTRLFQNLIGNAVKFRGQQDLFICLQAENAGPDWLFSVSDNGIGIAPEYAEVIFTIFHRLHVRSEYPGNGIGLAICRKIVEHYGGRIWVESQLGRGSTFKFTLPAGCPDQKGGARP